MRRLLQTATLIAVASAIPAAPLLVAQDAKPGGTTTKAVTVEVKKAGDVKDAAKVEMKKIEAAAAEARAAEAKVEMKQVVVRRAGVVQANLDQQARQFLQQFRPAMRAEYYFLRNVCKPTAEQRPALARAAESALWEVAHEYSQVQGKPMRVVNGRVAYPDPKRMLEEAMAKSVAPALTPEQAARFKAESGERATDRRRAIAENVVARMDLDLVLSADQREKIVAAALEKWEDSWCQSLETLTYGDQFYPRLPDSVVIPHLDDRQAALWRGTQHNQSFFFGFVGNMMPNQDDPKEDRELVEAQAEAEKAHAKDAPAAGAGVPNAIPLPAAVKAAAPARVAPAEPKK